MTLLDKMLKNSTIKYTDTIENSELFNNREGWSTTIPALNVALTGEIDGEFNPGMLAIAGPSKHFKSLFALLIARSYLEKYSDGIMLLYDSEFGAPLHYFNSIGIDTKRVVHTPVTTVEELRHDCVNQLKELTRGDKVIVVIDSIGNLASNKEVADAESGNQAADMTRAKALKSFGRIVTPHLSLKNIPMIVINHTYEELALYPKQIMSGGCLVEGTKIVMADGSLRNIELVRENEKVMTLQGPRNVTHTWNPDTLLEGEPQCFEIELENGYTVVCSKQHKFLIDGQWVCAKDLKIGDNVYNIYD